MCMFAKRPRSHLKIEVGVSTGTVVPASGYSLICDTIGTIIQTISVQGTS